MKPRTRAKTGSDVIDMIIRRRSVRCFRKKVVFADSIERILEAGRWAPSGLNNQPWRFDVVEGEKKDRLAEWTKYGYILRGASVAVCVALDAGESYNRDKDWMAIGACIENMLLAVESLDLGACWLGEILNKKKQVQEFLGWEEDWELAAVVAIGYPRSGAGRRSRKPLKKLMAGEA